MEFHDSQMNDIIDKVVVDPEQYELNKMKGKGFGMKLFLNAEQNQEKHNDGGTRAGSSSKKFS